MEAKGENRNPDRYFSPPT